MSEPSLGVPETAHVDVFISYRRNEASYLAGWLHDTLTARLGRDRVFLDIDAIRPGVDFMQTISTAVARARLVLVVIGPRWLRDAAGRLRLEEPDDPVRLEVESAIAAGVVIVPLLLDGARMPTASELPPSVAPLLKLNALPVAYRTFRRDVDELLRAYGDLVPAEPSHLSGFDPPPPETASARAANSVDIKEEREQRRRLLARLHRTYREHLGQSLDDEHIVRIPLRLRWAPAQVRRPLDALLAEDRPRDVLAPDGTTLVDVFDETGGLDGDGFLVLGEPGAGKSTALVQLCVELTLRALDDSTHPIPVYMPLQAWSARRRHMAPWLVRQLDELYDVPPWLGQQWTSRSELLFVFDGLDELARSDLRTGCITEINRFHRFGRQRRLPSVVASRKYEYDVLNSRLELENAVCVLPLQPDRVLRELVEAGSRMGGVLAAVQDDEALRELCTSPLLVSLMTLTYTDDHRAPVPAADVRDRRRQLFSSYVARRFVVEQRGRAGPRRNAYRPANTLSWLSWLASTMTADRLPVFVLGRLDHRWMPSRLGRWMVAVLPGALFGVVYGAIGLIFGTSARPSYDNFVSAVLGAALAVRMKPGPTSAGRATWSWSATRSRAPTALLGALVVALILGLIELAFAAPGALERGDVFPLDPGYSLTLFIGVGVASVLLGGLTMGAEPADQWRAMRPELSTALVVGLVVGLSVGAARGLSGDLPTGGRTGVGWAVVTGIGAWLAAASGPAERVSWSWRRATAHLTWLVGLSLAVGAVTAAGYVMYAGLHEGLVVGAVTTVGAIVASLMARGADRTSIPVHLKPNDATRRSFQYGMLVGVVTFIVVGIAAGCLAIVVTEEGWIGSVLAAFVVGIDVGAVLAVAFGVGAAAQHWLIRVVLWTSGVAPLRLQRWLNYAVSLRLLYRSASGGFVFVHQLLQEYFHEDDNRPTDPYRTGA